MNLFMEGFHLKAKGGTEIDIPINAKVTILTGDSATGKTKMITELSDILSLTHEMIFCNVEKSQIIVIKDMSAYNLFIDLAGGKEIENHVIFIDKFDLTDFKESIPFIQSSNNYFILCAHRTVPKCGQETDSILEMRHDGLKYKAVPLTPGA